MLEHELVLGSALEAPLMPVDALPRRVGVAKELLVRAPVLVIQVVVASILHQAKGDFRRPDRDALVLNFRPVRERLLMVVERT